MLILALAIVASASCATSSEPSRSEMLRATNGLAATFPILAELGVRGYRSQDWCSFLDYERGLFSTAEKSVTCNLSDRDAQPFDAQARVDFDRLREAFRESTVPVRMAWGIVLDDSGSIEAAEFDLEHPSERWAYVYDSSGDAPTGLPGESRFTRLSAHWLFWWEDPN